VDTGNVKALLEEALRALEGKPVSPQATYYFDCACSKHCTANLRITRSIGGSVAVEVYGKHNGEHGELRGKRTEYMVLDALDQGKLAYLLQNR
jgi:hypothetical protein